MNHESEDLPQWLKVNRPEEDEAGLKKAQRNLCLGLCCVIVSISYGNGDFFIWRNTMKKRITSLALALIMLCGMMPIGAFADDTAPVETTVIETPTLSVEPELTPVPTPTPASEPESTPAPAPGAEPAPSTEPAVEPVPSAEPTVEPTPGAELEVEPTPSTEPTPSVEEDNADDEIALLGGISTYALSAFDESLLNAIPATASNSGWKSDGSMIVSGNKGQFYSSATLTLTFTADAHISFQYKVSSGVSDNFSVKHNSMTIVNKVSGVTDWVGVAVDVKADDTLTFVYKKGGNYSTGVEDRAYLTGFSAGEPTVVTFYANNGTDDSTTQNFYGTAALNANTFTKDHAVFDGWALTADGEKKYGDEETIDKPAEALSLYALWADAKVVSFYNGTGGLIASVNVRTGSAIPADAIPTPARTGYIFSGWRVDGAEFNTAAPITADITLTAAWMPIEYTVRFSANNGAGSMTDMTGLKYGERYYLPKCSFVREGYTFAGWGSSSYTSTASYADEASISNLSSTNGAVVTLYAVWYGKQVPVTVDLNYDTENRVSTRTCVVGQNYNYIYNEATGSAKYSSLSDPKRDGYRFLGWYTAAEGGDKITTSDKFTSTDAVTMYAHWVKTVTITFDANGGSCYTKTKVIDEGGTCSSLPSASLSGKTFIGWFTEIDGGQQVTTDTTFTADTTLYAHYKNKQYIIVFNANGADGEMDSITVDSGVEYTLPPCSFTRDGYNFKHWSTSSYDSSYSTHYLDCGTIKYTASYDNARYNLYAIWEQTVFGKAFDAIKAALPDNNTVYTTGALKLPTSGDGWSVEYSSDNSSYISSTAEVLTLPVSGTKAVTLTATVTDTANGTSQTRDYTLTLYSAEAKQAEDTLKEALGKLTGNFTPVYGTDKNACRALEALLKSKGYEGIRVSVKTPAADDYASIAANGTITYHFEDKMSGSDSYLRPVYSFTLSGVTLDKELQTRLTWDLGKAHARIDALAASITVPEELSADDTLTLPKYQLKAGIDPDAADYSDYTQFDSWATITWTATDASGEDSEILKIGASGSSSGYYAPHTVTIVQPKDDTNVTLTAKATWNKDNSVYANMVYTVKVKGSDTDIKEQMRKQLEAKLDAALKSPGLTDIVTGNALDTGNVVNDIRFPSTRDFGVNGQKQPITITSSNESVIPSPDVNNAVRANVYRPAPGEEAVAVTLTITITDTETGAVASRDVTVTVQPLTDAELDAEIALMEQVKAHYFDGIKGKNTKPDEITTDLTPFSEVYLDEGGNLVWVYKYAQQVGHGIVPVALDGWYASEQWRLFKSSNAQVISHESLAVTRDKEHKSVTVESCLSSEAYGKYAARYPGNAKLQQLYNQPVSAKLTVLGTDPTSDDADEKKLSVLFTLSDNGAPWISCAYSDLAEGVTVYDVFYRALSEKGYAALGGSFVTGIVKPDGTVLSQKDRGEYSGWMYAVNGSIPGVVMSQYFLSDGDSIQFFYTDDYTALYGKKSEYTVDEVIKLIDAIGEVTIASGDAISTARRAYETLTQAEKAQVSNYNILKEAEKAYAALIKKNGEILDIYTTTGDYIQRDEDSTLCKFGSEWFILGLARSGRDVPEEYIDALEAYVSARADNNGRLSATKPTENARVILTLTALGLDPADFGGADLLAPLGDMAYIEVQPLSGAIYTLLALNSGDYDVPAAPDGKKQTTREALIEYLLDKQLDDGGWAFSGDSAEVDATAMVLQALSAYYDPDSKDALTKRVNAAAEAAIALLSDMQSSTGGYESYGTLNSESCAQVITAVTAYSIDPHTDKRFIKNGISVVDALCSFYVEGGGFSHTLTAQRDTLATAQGYYALTAYYRLINGEAALFDMRNTEEYTLAA